MKKTRVIATMKDGGSRILEYDNKLYYQNRSAHLLGSPIYGSISYLDAPSRYRIGDLVPFDLYKSIIAGLDEKEETQTPVV